ncbi:uncharacterized protein LOC132642441 [Lycium barbarum]|uniref:uncharacterized protein LOC132642441 n=1 Tax=Lycium barbarum TaxID=112863 RepID=UPI00293E2DA6|nr:uncharacterized protein LOC132642441 [Lycium barbarum]
MPRMIKWLSAKLSRKANSNSTNIDPLVQTRKEMQNQIVHPFLFPTNIEKRKDYIQDITPFEDGPDPNIDVLKAELAHVTTIKLDIVGGDESLERAGGEESVVRDYGVDQRVTTQTISPHMDFNNRRSFGGVGGGDSYAADLGMDVDTPGVTKTTGVNISKVSCCCECKKCCHKHNALLEALNSLSVKLENQQPKRNRFPSYVMRSPYTPELRRRLAINTKDKNGRTKNKLRVDLYKPLATEKIEAFKDFLSKKEEERRMYLSDELNYQDLENMTDPNFSFECKVTSLIFFFFYIF